MYTEVRNCTHVAAVAAGRLGSGGLRYRRRRPRRLRLRRRRRQGQDEWTRSYKVAAGGRLELINVNGRITAEASDGADSASSAAERTAKAATDEAATRAAGQNRDARGGRRRPRPRRGAARRVCSGPFGPRDQVDDQGAARRRRRSADRQRRRARWIGLDGDLRARSTNGGITGTALIASTRRRGGHQRRRRDRAGQGRHRPARSISRPSTAASA